MKHSKLQKVKKVANLTSDFMFVLDTLKQKWTASHVLPTSDLGGRKKTQENKNHLTKAIPMLA